MDKVVASPAEATADIPFGASIGVAGFGVAHRFPSSLIIALRDQGTAGLDRVVIEIVAGPDACADCLVPLPVMEAIMSGALGPTRYALDHIVLPAAG